MFVGNVGQETQSTSRHDFRPPGTPAGVFAAAGDSGRRQPKSEVDRRGYRRRPGRLPRPAFRRAAPATWHSPPSPSPAAPVAAPAAPVAAPPEPHSSETTGTFLPLADVVSMVSGDFQDQIGHAPERVNCPGDLDGHVGAFERCSIADNGKRYTADLTVTAVNGIQVSTRDTIAEEGPPPSRP